MAINTEKQAKFVDQFVLHGNATRAAIEAGFSPKSAEQKGCNLKSRFALEITVATRKAIIDAVPSALAQLKTLSLEAESESVRLQACKDVLDRAGLKPTDRVETITVEKSTIELRAELDSLMALEGDFLEDDEDEAPARLN